MSIDLADAIEAIRPYMGCCVDCPHEHSGVDVVDAQALLAAALPHIETQIREQVAAEIEACRPEVGPQINVTPYRDGLWTAYTIAATIARTPKETDHD